VCKLNPVTEDEDLELIFSRFDPNAQAEIIRDPDTGQSLQYAFIEFTTPEQCNEAYFKMNNTLIDDRRIKVDFSQSVAKIWNKYSQRRRGSHDGETNKQNHGDGRTHEQRQQNSQINHSKRGAVVPNRQPPYYEKESDRRERPSRNEDSERRHHHHHRHKREDRDRERKRSRSRDREYHDTKTSSMSQNRESHAQVEKDHKHRSHHHKDEDPDLERKRRRSHQRRDYSDSDQSSDSRSRRRHKSHRKHKKKHKSRSRSRSRS